MRKLYAATFISLDGVMQAPGGPNEDTSGGFRFGGWNVPFWDEAMGQWIDKAMERPFDLLLGRRTYDIFAAHWPRVPAGDPIADKFNGCTKYVVTSSTAPLSWVNSQAVHGDVAGAVARLKATDGPDILIQGSSQVIQALLPHNLIDEFGVMIFPVVLGEGKRLFGSGTVPASFRASDTTVSSTGAIMTTYRPDGPVRTGSFALEDQSQ